MTKVKNVLSDFIQRPIKVQIISREIPVENTRGNATYILNFLQYLQQMGYKIEYILPNSLLSSRTPWHIISPTLAKLANVVVKDNLKIGRLLLRFNSLSDWLIESLRLIYDRLPETLKNIYRSARDQRQLTPMYAVPSCVWDAPLLLEETAFINSQFLRFKPDIVIANYAFLANVLDSPVLDKNVLKVILTHDVRHQRVAQFKKLGLASSEPYWSKEQEIIELSKAQVLLAIQEEDANVFKEMVPQCEVICMPMSVNCHSHTIKQIPGRCLFVGSGINHNYYGLQWFLENVWAKVIELSPHSSLHVCGTVCDLIEGSFPNVRLLGRVDDLKPEYSAAEVCLVPLLAGSGLKIKLVEAMSYGRACVSTSVGVQGLREVAGKTILVADTVEDFALGVHTLLTNPDKRQWMEKQAYKYVSEKFSPKAAYQPFVDYIYQHLQQVSNQPKIVPFEETVSLDKVISSKK
ncbi:glycosyltransferase family 4 protein [Scytonema sp. PRP1]|uniref:glycosyltransferase family 4 protein n=1 Tax=Scytonema sp. PRP1 TaxID=3120513 RepID=UPI002FD03EF4